MDVKRIVVVGNSGAGKSILSRELGARLGLPFVASDPLYWEPNWVPASTAVVRQRLDEVTAADSWILDGNCISDRDIVWGRAQALVWLDYERSVVLRRVCRRNLGWVITRERVWSGNRMHLGHALSGIRHARRTYAQKRATYPGYLLEFPHLRVLRFETPRELSEWSVGDVGDTFRTTACLHTGSNGPVL